MPSAFGGKRASERIAEAVGAEKGEAETEEETGNNASTGDKLASLPEYAQDSSLPKLPNPLLSNLDGTGPAKNRDSRSTVGTRSSLDFSSSASFSADSTAPSSALGPGARDGVPTPTFTASDPASVSHSASNSFSLGGLSHSQSSKDLNEAMQRLSVDVMANHQCLVTFSPVQTEESRTPSAMSQGGFPGKGSYTSFGSTDQLPFPTSNGANGSGYPYQQYHPQPIGTPESHSSAFVPGGADGIGFPGLNGSSLSLSGLNPSSGSAQNVLAQDALAISSLRNKVPQYNFHLSGGYQQVMSARGAILRENPFKIKSTIKVPRADVLEAAIASSPGTDPVKPDVRRKLDEICAAAGAAIHVAAAEVRGADLGYGLETERMAELIISGSFESVEMARIKTLVLLDELVSMIPDRWDTCSMLTASFFSPLCILFRTVSIPRPARLITSFTTSSEGASDVSFKRFKKRLAPTSTYPPLSRICSTADVTQP